MSSRKSPRRRAAVHARSADWRGWSSRDHYLRLSGTAEASRRSAVSRSMSVPAKPWRWLASGGKQGTVFQLYCASTIRNAGRITLDGSRCPRPPIRAHVRARIAVVPQESRDLRHDDCREHPLRTTRCGLRRNRGGGTSRPHRRFHRPAAGRLRHTGRRARRHAFGRPAPAIVRLRVPIAARCPACCFSTKRPARSISPQPEARLQHALERLMEPHDACRRASPGDRAQGRSYHRHGGGACRCVRDA